MSEIVRYGGAAQRERADDNCFGQYDRIYESMKKVAMLLICSSPSLALAGRDFIKTSQYNGEYAIVVDAFSKIFTIIDEASMDLAGRRDKCTDLSDVAWGMLGMKQCNKGNAKMEGFFGLIVEFFKNNLGGTAVVAALSTSNGILAVYTTMRNFIARMLTNVMCAIYYHGRNGMVGTWVIAKAIIQTIGQFANAGGILSTNIALGIGGAILKYVTGLGRWNQNEFIIPNDTPAIEDVENNIADIDNGVVVSDVGLATGLSEAVDELENTEDHTEGGDELINDYVDDVEQIEWDFHDNANNLKFMQKYLRDAIKDTEKGGHEYEDHKELANMIKQLSGKWRPPTDMHDLGNVSQVAASQPMDETEYDSAVDPSDHMNQTLERTRSYGNDPYPGSVPYGMGGIIKKKDSKFIKNLNKSMKKMRKGLQSKKAGYNYMQKNKGTKKYIRHRNINPGFSKKKAGKKAGKKTKGLGKGIRVSKRNTKRRKLKRGRG
tara:strand:- start:510 stop:1979 length:1470 start_codon:yes stop_codon:yes gene_type:complete